MRNVGVDEVLSVVSFVVQSDDLVHTYLVEDRNVLVWVVTEPLVGISLLDWAHECHELMGNDPVEITVLDSLHLLVFFDVESSEVVPPKIDGPLQALEALEQGALVCTVALASISVMLEVWTVIHEFVMGLFRSHLEDNDAEATHQEGTVDHLVSLFR